MESKLGYWLARKRKLDLQFVKDCDVTIRQFEGMLAELTANPKTEKPIIEFGQSVLAMTKILRGMAEGDAKSPDLMNVRERLVSSLKN